MNGSLVGAWVVGEGIVIYRQVAKGHRLPVPGALVGVTVLFIGLGLFGEIVPSASRFASLVGWGLDAAGVLNLFRNTGLPGQIAQAQKAEKTTTPATVAPGSMTGGGQ